MEREPESSILLFVYGTLMRGGCRSGVLAGQRFLGEARTEPLYRMFDCGTYPGLVEDRRGRTIVGELWEVSAECLHKLDRIEWVNEGLYERRTIRLRPPCPDRPVEAYFYLASTAGLRDCGGRWINESA